MSLRGLSRTDLLPTAVASLLVVADVLLNPSVRPLGAALGCGLAGAAALTFRRRQPLTVAVVAAAAVASSALLGVPLDESLAPLLLLIVATYSVAAHGDLPRALGGLAVMLAADAAGVLAQDKGIGNFVFGLLWIVLAWTTGRVTRARSAETRALAVRAEQAAADERARIARELHDVISHSVTVMVVQAGAAEEVIRRDPEQALTAVQAVQSTGRQALGELSRLLGVLRDAGDSVGQEQAPMPGLGDIEDLVESTRQAGLPVQLEVRGRRRALPAGLELSVYRIVQEALTNVRKHAGAARASVLLEYERDAVVAEVSDEGGDARSNGSRGGGHGLIGMRERAAVYGGDVQAGPRPEGGFQVRARLPASEPGP